MVKLKELIEEELLNEASNVKGKMMTLLKKDFKIVHDGFVGNVIDSPDLTDEEKYQAFGKFRKMMDTARSNYVSAVIKATKPFDKKLTGR